MEGDKGKIKIVFGKSPEKEVEPGMDYDLKSIMGEIKALISAIKKMPDKSAKNQNTSDKEKYKKMKDRVNNVTPEKVDITGRPEDGEDGNIEQPGIEFDAK